MWSVSFMTILVANDVLSSEALVISHIVTPTSF
jgi:hypothetical protein